MTARAAALPPPPAARPWLWAEFAGLFLGVPLALAFVLPPSAMWTVLIGGAATGLALLQLTPGFSWRELLRGPVVADRRLLTLTVLGTAATAVLATLALVPQALFILPLRVPELWLLILLLYPLAAAAAL